jgi:uncharacterized protein with GYD domain
MLVLIMSAASGSKAICRTYNTGRCNVAKYLIYSTYTAEGLKGLLKEGGTSRRTAVEQAVKALGGTVEAYYYAFGDTDIFIICDLPDNVTVTAATLVGSVTGMSNVKTIVLITPEEVDQATDLAKKMAAEYRPPGG